MTILERLTRALRPPPNVRQLPTHGGYSSYQYGKPVALWPRANLNTYYGYYDQVVVAFACINLIADAAAAAKVRVYDAAKDDAELPDHPMRQLLATPNDYMSETEFLNTLVKLAAVAGFAVAEKERSGAGRVVGLHPLRSDWLKPVPRENNMTDWEYKLPSGETFQLLAEDVVSWTYQGDMRLSATGTTPLCAANRELAIEHSMVNFTKAFFDGGGVPMTGLVVDDDAQFSQAQADTIREKFMQLAAEPWKPVILDAFKDVKRLGFDLNEMAYKDLRHLTSTQICTAFRVPPVMLGTLAGLENSPWSKYEEARKSFYEDTITPLWARLDGALTRSLLPDFESRPSISLEFDTSEIPAFQEDDTADWQKITLPGIAAVATVNERRAVVGLPPLAGGDVRILGLADVEVPATTALNGSRSNGNGHAIVDPFVTRIYEILDEAREEVTAFKPLPIGMMRRLPAEQRARVATTNKQHIIKIGERGAVWLRKFWRDQGERVLSAMFRAQAPGWEHRDDVGQREPVDVAFRALNDPFWAEEERLLAQQLGQIHHLAGKTAFGAASDVLGVDVEWNLANPNVQRVLDRLGQSVTGINDTTRTQLQDLVGDQLNQGVSLQQLADAVKEQFDGYGDARAMTTARSESQVAYNTASALGYKESGVASNAELIDNPDHGGYGGDDDGYTCAERDGMIVPVENVSIHAEGTHPNCILAIVPVLDTALGEEE